jgi:hypothetical protein
MFYSRDLAATDRELRHIFPDAQPAPPLTTAGTTAASVVKAAPPPSSRATSNAKAFQIVIPTKVCGLDGSDQ